MRSAISKLSAAFAPLTLTACLAGPLDRGVTVRSDRPSEVHRPILVSVGPCFGFCPVYDVTVFPDGTIDFAGQRHTTVLGARRGNAGAAVYRRLLADLSPFRPAAGATAQVECDAAISDTPSYTITWTEPDGRRTTATHQGGCPRGPGHRLDPVLQGLPDRLGIATWTRQVTRPGVSRG